MKSDKWTIRICASIWGTILFFVSERMFTDDRLLMLFGIPAASIPFLIYAVHENAKHDRKTTGAEIFAGVLLGGIYAILWALPHGLRHRDQLAAVKVGKMNAKPNKERWSPPVTREIC